MNIHDYHEPDKIVKLENLKIGDIGYFQKGIMIAFDADDSFEEIKNEHGAVCVSFYVENDGGFSYNIERHLSDWVYFPVNPIVFLINNNARQTSINSNPKRGSHPIYLDYDGRLLLSFNHWKFDLKSKQILSGRFDTAYLMRINDWMFAENNGDTIVPILHVRSEQESK